LNSLISWLGTKDCENYLKDEHASISTILVYGTQSYDEIHILDNRYQKERNGYKKWLCKKLTQEKKQIPEFVFHDAKIKSPIDFKTISSTLNPLLKKLSDLGHSISINFTSGTPAMSSISALLGYGIYNNVQLIQTNDKQKVFYDRLPFDFKTIYYEQKDNELERLIGNDPKIESAFENMISNSDVMRESCNLAKKIAVRDITCLILGETGTGKEMMAQAIHKASVRGDKTKKPIAINCGAISKDLIEVKLFGAKKGSFTGATHDIKGAFEEANGGSLFLDEIGELPLEAQTKLLRVLQEKEITRITESIPIKVNVRIIAATHRNLAEMVDEGTFREDLYYRIAIGVINLPPLRERNEDIMQIANELLDESNKESSNQPNYINKMFYKDVNKFIKNYSWPGNVRELKNTITRATIWSDDKNIKAEHLEKSLLERKKKSKTTTEAPYIEKDFNLNQHLDITRRIYLEQALNQSSGNKTKAAKLLGLPSVPTVHDWIKEFDISS